MISALIVAAGKGTRMGPNVDKVFLELAGLPVVAHTWRRFDRLRLFDEVVLVVREGMENAFQEIAQRLTLTKPFRLVHGGKERQDSVWNGLAALSGSAAIVAIQDAARPCTSDSVIASTVETARRMGAAVAAQPVIDTIKESGNGKLIERTLDRSRLWAVQTPQAFQVRVIRQALVAARAKNLLLTDDTAACELIGQAVELVVSTQPNPKVTRPEDVPYVEFLLSQMSHIDPTSASV